MEECSISSKMKFLKKLAEEGLNLLYPQNLYCICCGDAIESSNVYGLCKICTEKIDWFLENPFSHSMNQFSFDDIWTCCRYGFYPRQILSRFKLSGNPFLARHLGLLMAERLKLTEEKDFYLANVPMFIEKQQKRGFNQTELLALEISKETGAIYLKNLLIKTAATKSMRLSDGQTRRNSDKKVYEFSSEYSLKIQGKHIVLIDDVITTGSTADACAVVLKANGAKRVSILCFASAKEYLTAETENF